MAAAGQGRDMDHIQRARVRAGDPDAFGMLFDDYARAVYNLAFRLTGNWSTAEEVVSLTFLEAWRVRGRVAPAGGPLRPWLLGIAVNVTRNLTRAARRHQAALSRLPGEESVPDFAEELAGRIDDSAALRRLAAGLAALRPPSGMLALCVWSGLTTRRRPARWASRSAPCAPAVPGPRQAARAGRGYELAGLPGSPRPAPLTALTVDRGPAARPVQEETP
jgi:RNA polymerase sigma-70 factor (ECF subfamily)